MKDQSWAWERLGRACGAAVQGACSCVPCESLRVLWRDVEAFRLEAVELAPDGLPVHDHDEQGVCHPSCPRARALPGPELCNVTPCRCPSGPEARRPKA